MFIHVLARALFLLLLFATYIPLVIFANICRWHRLRLSAQCPTSTPVSMLCSPRWVSPASHSSCVWPAALTAAPGMWWACAQNCSDLAVTRTHSRYTDESCMEDHICRAWNSLSSFSSRILTWFFFSFMQALHGRIGIRWPGTRPLPGKHTYRFSDTRIHSEWKVETCIEFWLIFFLLVRCGLEALLILMEELAGHGRTRSRRATWRRLLSLCSTCGSLRLVLRVVSLHERVDTCMCHSDGILLLLLNGTRVYISNFQKHGFVQVGVAVIFDSCPDFPHLYT